MLVKSLPPDWRDPIVEETREARRQIMAEHGNDILRLVDSLSARREELCARVAAAASSAEENPLPYEA